MPDIHDPTEYDAEEPDLLDATSTAARQQVADLDGAPAALGEDVHGRPFVSFVVEHGGKRRLATLFQRYTCSCDGVWAIAGALPLSGALHEDNRAVVRALCSEAGHRFWDDEGEPWRAALATPT